MYHVSAQGVDERMINVHYFYYDEETVTNIVVLMTGDSHKHCSFDAG